MTNSPFVRFVEIEGPPLPPSNASRTHVVTRLPASELGEIFQRSMRVSWYSELLGRGTKIEPDYESGVGSMRQDKPDHAFVAKMGGGGGEIQGSYVHMELWDRGDTREVDLLIRRHLAAVGLKAKAKISRFVRNVQASDPTATVVNR